MKKNILYIIVACMTLSLAACSDDYEDASTKHVYGTNESPYLRTDPDANITLSAEFRKGHVTPVVVNLTDYAETIQSKLGMTVDQMIAGVSSGKLVFYNINTDRGVWDKTATTKGANGWYYTAKGMISNADNQAGSIELDAANKTLVISVPDNSEAGITFGFCVGFAVDNGQNYDQYVRFTTQIAVTDPGLIMPSFTIPEGDYASFEVVFADYEQAIQTCMGMTAAEFNTVVQDPDGDIAMYMVDAAGKWMTGLDYTANNIGYWCEGDGTPRGWGDGCVYFVETHDGTVGVGRYPGIPSGTQKIIHFVYASKSDPSKFVEFICNATFE
jgi:hypothetical protein